MLFLLTKIRNLKRRWYHVKCASNNEVNKKNLCTGGFLGNVGSNPCNKCPYYKYNKYEEEVEDEK